MKTYSIFLLTPILLVVFSALPFLSFAATPTNFSTLNTTNFSTLNTPGGQLCNPLGGCGATGPQDLTQFIALVLKAVVKIGAVVVVFFVIYAGFLLVTASGNEEKLKKAKNALLWTLVGAAILLGAQLLADVITNTIANISRP